MRYYVQEKTKGQKEKGAHSLEVWAQYQQQLGENLLPRVPDRISSLASSSPSLEINRPVLGLPEKSNFHEEIEVSYIFLTNLSLV